MLKNSFETGSYGSVDIDPISSDSLISKESTWRFSTKCLILLSITLLGIFLIGSFHGNSNRLILADISNNIESEDNSFTAYVVAGICELENAGDLNNDDMYYMTITTSDGSSDATAITSDRSESGTFIAEEISVPGETITSITIDGSSADDSLCISSISVYIGDIPLGESTKVWISNNCDNVDLSPCYESYTFAGLDNTCNDIDIDTLSTEYVVSVKIADQQYAGTTAELGIELIGVNQATSGTLSLNGATELVRDGFYAFRVSSEISLGPEILTAIITFPTTSENAVLISKYGIAPIKYPGSMTFSLNSYWLDANGEGENGCDATFETYGCQQSVTLTLGCTSDDITYQFVATSVDSTYDAARAECISQGGDLAIFSDLEEYTEIYNLCTVKAPTTGNIACYLGYNDLGYEVGDFRTLNGEPLSETYMQQYVNPSIDPNDAWDRCGCITINKSFQQSLDDCTCDYSTGVPGICAIPISS